MASSVIERMRYSHQAEERNRPWPRYTTTLRDNSDSGNVDKQIDYVFKCRYFRKRITHWSRVAVQIHQAIFNDVTIYIACSQREHCRCWSSLADKFRLKQKNVVHQIKQDFIHRFLTYVKYKVLIHGSACRRKYNKNWFAFLNDKGVYRARWFIVYNTDVCVRVCVCVCVWNVELFYKVFSVL